MAVPGAPAATNLGAEPAQAMVMADAPSAATVRIDPSASLRGYATPAVTLAKGGTLSVVNFDSTRHSVTSDDHDASGNALFSAIVDPGGTATVDGVSLLAPGTYPFHCIFHAATMRGTLTISGSGGGVQPAPLSFDQPLTRPRTLRTAKMRIPIRRLADER